MRLIRSATISGLTIAAIGCGESGPAPAPQPQPVAQASNSQDQNVSTNSSATSLAELVRLRNEELGGCPNCREGETFAVSEQRVEHGLYTYTTSPTCQNSAAIQQEMNRAVEAAGNAAAGNYAGAAEGLIESETFRQFASENVRGSLGQILNRGRSDTANCRAICVVVPTQAVITGYRAEAANETGDFQACSAGQDCSIGWSKWIHEPAGGAEGPSRTMCGTFANWADSGHRRARLTVMFRPAEGWVPPR